MKTCSCKLWNLLSLLTQWMLSISLRIARRQAMQIELTARLLNSKHLVNEHYLGILKRNQVLPAQVTATKFITKCVVNSYQILPEPVKTTKFIAQYIVSC